jgi:gliding motility-associated lipoprotein GldH
MERKSLRQKDSFHQEKTKGQTQILLKMNKIRIAALSLLFSILASCSGDRIFENFESMETGSWEVSDSVSFELSNLDLENRTSLIAVRFNETYEFSNCYIRVISMDSASTILENTLINVPLFDSKSGEPIGKGFGNSYTRYDTIPFILKAETKKLAFVQYMRQDKLKGIEAIGLKILK